MKLSSVVMLGLLVSFVFVAWGLLIQDFETNYIDTNISTATSINETFLQDFDSSEELNESMQPIFEGFKDIATDEGFFDKLQDLAVVVPLAIISVPGVIFNQLVILISLISRFSDIVNIPVQIIVITIIGVFMFILFKLVAFWRRTPV